MVNRNLLREFDLGDEDLSQFEQAFAKPDTGGNSENWFQEEKQAYEANKLVNGKVTRIVGDKVIIDIGYKSEGEIPLEEWKEEGNPNPVFPKVGDEVQVLLDSVEDESGTIILSFRKAKRQKEWEAIIEKHKEGDVVAGHVTKKIKGGLLVNIGVNVFLPASQVDIRRPPDIGEYCGKTIDCKILKIDEIRRNIVVSRRKLLEDQREDMKRSLLSEIQPGQIRKGVVKNIADFGAFVDLGGIDGLLHITDMTWGRISNPHEIVKIDQPIEVYIINVDRDREKIALGLKQ
ncbi:MAG: 30S ribosomal protein S1, partial [Gemmataceae bacterium]